MTDPTPQAQPNTAGPSWLIDRDVHAVAVHLDPWILAAEPDHDPQTTAVPLLGTPEWVAADDTVKNAAVAIYVLACLAEREPVVIAARLAAEIAAGRTAHLDAAGLARHQHAAALSMPGTEGVAELRRWVTAMAMVGIRVGVAMTVPTTVGPVAPRVESRARPSTREPAPVSTLNAES